jgi:spermidine/putrescine transport system substrate-binding protein
LTPGPARTKLAPLFVEGEPVTRSSRALVLILVFTGLVGCTKKEDDKVLNLSIWGDYISEATKQEFTQKTGIVVNMSNYFSNEELLAKVQSGAGGVDVAVPSDYMVEIMAKMNFLEKLDKSKIPNIGNIDPQFLQQIYDPDNTYSLPYSWSTAGFAYNTTLIKKDLKSWKDVIDDANLDGKMSLMDDMREVMGLALKAQKHSVNDNNPDDIKAAVELLKKLKPRVKMFKSDTVDALMNKEVALAHAYSSSAVKAMVLSHGKIKYVLPLEGGTKAIDNLVILKNSKHLAAAYQFLNFLLTQKADAAFVTTIYGGPVIKGVKELLPKELQGNEALFPALSTLSRFEFIHDLGKSTQLYDDAWTQVKTAE